MGPMPRLTLALVLATSACCSHPGGEPLAHQIDDTRAHVDALRTEVEAHAAAATATSDLAGMQAMEPMHREDTRGHMDMLGHAIDDMGMCGGVPDDDLDAMMQTHDVCADEIDRHEQAMSTASDLAAARAEEEQHRATLMGLLDDLDEMADEMMDGRGDMMCGGHHGMDDREDS